MLRRAHVGDPNDFKSVGKSWTERFISRTPGLSKLKRKPVELERAAALDNGTLQEYFSKPRKVMDGNGIQDSDVWNMDE
ncbi:hypothetical protein OC844_007192, partial [Tilletia horrida]